LLLICQRRSCFCKLDKCLLDMLHFFLRQLFELQQPVARAIVGSDELVELELERLGIAVLGVLDQEHHEEVTIVAPVLMISCQVSDH